MVGKATLTTELLKNTLAEANIAATKVQRCVFEEICWFDLSCAGDIYSLLDEIICRWLRYAEKSKMLFSNTLPSARVEY
jgi:hypothetical protein